MPSHTDFPLSGRTALVTGVSRRRGIGFAVARRLAALGVDLVIHHYRPHDLAQPWGGDDLDAVRDGIRSTLAPGARFADVGADLDAVRDGIRSTLAPGARFADVGADLADPAQPARVMDAAAALTGHVDVLVCNHAQSGGDGSILDMTAERLDAFWDSTARSTLLLTAEFARRKAGAPDAGSRAPGERIAGAKPYAAPTGHVFWMTSGQIHAPMRGEVGYASAKAALAGVTATVAAELLELGIVLNTVNPGPVNTGYLDPETADRPLEELQAYIDDTPFGRFGRPEDPAALIGWLATAEGSWVVGQVLTSDGGFALG